MEKSWNNRELFLKNIGSILTSYINAHYPLNLLIFENKESKFFKNQISISQKAKKIFRNYCFISIPDFLDCSEKKLGESKYFEQINLIKKVYLMSALLYLVVKNTKITKINIEAKCLDLLIEISDMINIIAIRIFT